MAGSPLKRQRKAGIRADDGSVIAFPRLSHPRAGLSHAQWRALSPGEKIERVFDMSLDDLYEIMSWPMARRPGWGNARQGTVARRKII